MPVFSRIISNRSVLYPAIAFALFLLIPFISIKHTTAEKSTPEVLILNSYHQGEDWSDNILDGIRMTLEQEYPFIVPSIEHLDTKRFPDPNQLMLMKEYLKSKYQGRHFDIVMTVDNSALDLMLKFGEELFPGVPVVFAGINGYRPEMIKGHSNITGVAETQDMAGTLNLALTINSGIKTVLAIHDYTSSGLAVHRDMVSAADQFKDKVNVIFTQEGTVEDLVNQLKALPEDAIVMILTYVTDKNGRTLTREESTRIIASASPVPVYAMHETRLGYGILGGMLLDGREHGSQAAEITLKILSGTKAGSINVSKSRSRTIFDYKQIQRFNVSLKKFPSDSIIINLPVSFFEKYRAVLIPGSVLILLLTVILAVLSFSIVRIKRSNAKVRESETKYRNLVTNLSATPYQLVLSAKGDIRFEYMGENCINLFGLTANEILADANKVFEIIPQPDSERVQRAIDKSAETLMPYEVDHRIVKRDGETIWVHASSIPRKLPNGDVLWDGIGLNITSRKLAEKALLESEERYRSLFDNAQDAIFVADPESGILLEVNRSAEKLTGYSKQELIGKHQTFIHPSGEEDLYRKEFFKSVNEEGLIFKEMAVQTKDGRRIIVEISSGGTIESESRKLHLGIFRDITARKQAEENVRFQSALLESVGQAVIATDADGNISYWNKIAEQIYGWTADEVIGKNVVDVQSAPQDRGTALEIMKCLSAGRNWSGEFTVKRKDGQSVPVLVSDTPILNEHGKLIGIVGVSTDISERIKMENKLHQALKMESIGNLAGGIAHDFNNILSSIIGFTELALDETSKGTTLEENLQEVYLAGKRAKDLVKQILAFARQSDEKRSPIQPSTVAKEVLTFIRSTTPTTIEIRQEIDSKSWIFGNATQVHQVLMNLCTNAAHAMEESGGILEVRMKDLFLNMENSQIGMRQGNYIEIKVSDSGAGIAPEIIESIFEPYFTTKGVGEGTGMGLAMVLGIVESYGGKITVDSKPGKGSTFTIYLPIAKKRSNLGAYVPEQLPTGTERILFVDDEAPIANIGSQTLERLGYSVTTRTCSVEALELFKAAPDDFNLVVTDMTMPNMTGDKLAVELMKIRPDIPVILCTGYSKKMSGEIASKIGIKAFAYKPVVAADLAKTVRKVLDEAKS